MVIDYFNTVFIYQNDSIGEWKEKNERIGRKRSIIVEQPTDTVVATWRFNNSVLQCITL